MSPANKIASAVPETPSIHSLQENTICNAVGFFGTANIICGVKTIISIGRKGNIHRCFVHATPEQQKQYLMEHD